MKLRDYLIDESIAPHTKKWLRVKLVEDYQKPKCGCPVIKAGKEAWVYNKKNVWCAPCVSEALADMESSPH